MSVGFGVEFLCVIVKNSIGLLKILRLFLDNDVRNTKGKYFSELYHKKILHYRAASNWMNGSFEIHKSMIKLLHETLIQI